MMNCRSLLHITKTRACQAIFGCWCLSYGGEFIKHYFDIDLFRDTPHWNGVVLGIEADWQSSYRNRKRKLKKHFDTVGGYEDVATARKNPPPIITAKSWRKVIDRLFTTNSYKSRSVQNSDNRSKQPYSSSHGSESIRTETT